MTETLSAAQRDIIFHALGLDDSGRGRAWREHFVTEPTSSDGVICEQLVALGFMIRTRSLMTHEDDRIYFVTADGKRAANAARVERAAQ